tara:strand:- start:112 stop:333 length:222 start_codon:yes stop_codon:yes gene_type:complete
MKKAANIILGIIVLIALFSIAVGMSAFDTTASGLSSQTYTFVRTTPTNKSLSSYNTHISQISLEQAANRLSGN